MIALRALSLLLILSVATYAVAGVSLSGGQFGGSFEGLKVYQGR